MNLIKHSYTPYLLDIPADVTYTDTCEIARCVLLFLINAQKEGENMFILVQGKIFLVASSLKKTFNLTKCVLVSNSCASEL